MQRCGGGGARGVRAGIIASTDHRAVRRDRTLGPASRMGVGCVAGGFRAALSACRATMARMDCLLCADTGVDFEFSFHTEPQLSRNHEPEAALVVGRPDGVRSSWRDKSVDFSRSTQLAVAYCFFH